MFSFGHNNNNKKWAHLKKKGIKAAPVSSDFCSARHCTLAFALRVHRAGCSAEKGEQERPRHSEII